MPASHVIVEISVLIIYDLKVAIPPTDIVVRGATYLLVERNALIEAINKDNCAAWVCYAY